MDMTNLASSHLSTLPPEVQSVLSQIPPEFLEQLVHLPRYAPQVPVGTVVVPSNTVVLPDDSMVPTDTTASSVEADDDDEDDLEYDNLGEDEEEVEEVVQPKAKLTRGKNSVYNHVEHYKTTEEFQNSEFKASLLENFNLRKSESFIKCERETYECKFTRKQGFKSCPVKVKVSFSNSSDDVEVEETENGHSHIEETVAGLKLNPKYQKWSKAQANIVENGVRNMLDPTVIRRNLMESNLCEGGFPSIQQLYNKIAKVKSKQVPKAVTTTLDLREAVSKIDVEPEDENEVYVVDSEVQDEKEVRFHVTFTTKKMKARMSKELVQDDATYRLNWMGFPVFVSGRSSSTGKFFPTHLTLASHEDTRSWASTFRWVKEELGEAPKRIMADGAADITKAAYEVYGEQITRLMCWPHCSAKIDTRLKEFKKESKSENLHKKIKEDICNFQSSTTENEYISNFTSLINKYKGDGYTEDETQALDVFFKYFESTWGPGSHMKNWYAGANPWSITQNQGIEGKNQAIKKSYTFKSRVSIGRLFEITKTMLKEWSQQDDSILFKDRLSLLDSKEGLKLKTNGWMWSQKQNSKSVIKLPVSHKLASHTTSEAAGLGKPSRLWIVGRSKPNGDLKDLCKAKLIERSEPSDKSFDEKQKIKESCWVLEERDGDFWCDCPEGFKGHLCSHTIGMHIRQQTGKVEVTDQVRSVPLGERRGAGRPKGTGKKKIHCLTKSPPRRVMAANHDASSMSLGQEEEDEEEEVVAPRVVVVPRLAMPLEEEVEVPRQVVQEVLPRQVVQEVMPGPSLEEAGVILQGLQEVLKEKKVACTHCGKAMSQKSIKRHERGCQQARPPPSSSTPPSTPAPSLTTSLKRNAPVGRCTRARGQ